MHSKTPFGVFLPLEGLTALAGGLFITFWW